MTRGVGAFIEGAFGGYGWGEDLKEQRRNRARTDRLDTIAEEQRAIDNRRNDLRDRIMQDEHSYNQTLRERQMADEAAQRAAYADAAAATDEARTRGATPRPDATDVTIGGPVQADPAAQPGATPGGGMASGASAATPQNGPKNALTPKVNMGQSSSEPDLDAQAALAAADELVRRAEESRDPAAIQRALAARDALRERLLGPGLQAQQPPEAAPRGAMPQPEPQIVRSGITYYLQPNGTYVSDNGRVLSDAATNLRNTGPDLQGALSTIGQNVVDGYEARQPDLSDARAQMEAQRAVADRNAQRTQGPAGGPRPPDPPAAPYTGPDFSDARAQMEIQRAIAERDAQRQQGPAGGPRPPLPVAAPTPRGATMAFGDTPPGSMPAAPRTTMGDIERRNQLVNEGMQQAPQQPAPAQRPVLTDPGPLSPAGGPRTVNGPPAGGGPTGPEQFIPGTDMIPSPRDPNLPLPMDNGGARPGVTQEPVVNPMRAVGTPGVRGVPISAVMPPAARQQTQDAAPAVADNLESARTPSSTLLADSMRAAGARPEGPAAGMPAARGAIRPQARPTEGDASLTDPQGTNVTKDRPSNRETPRSWASTFAEVGVPIMEEQLLRAGRPDLAGEWSTWAASQTARDGYEAYARAGLALARGDITGFADAIQTLYDSDYMPDGWGTDRKASQFYRDEEGNIVGAQIVLRNSETGQMRVENYETIDELVSDLLMAVSPEAAFAAHIQQQQTARQQAQDRIIERQANNAETAQAIRDQLKVLEETRGNPTMPDPAWMAMTPEQRVAEAAAIVRASQAAAEGALPSPGAGPTVTQGAALPDWEG